MSDISCAMGNISYALILGVLGFLQAVSVAIIAGLFNRETRKRRADTEKHEKRAATRAEESRLAMKLMSANASLACATAIALKEGHTNGKVDKALKDAEKAQREYYDFINGVASSQMAAD